MGILGYLGVAIIVFAIVRFVVSCIKEKHDGD